MSIEIRNLHKRFGKTVVCAGLNLDIGSGELVALLGPSGSGKTLAAASSPGWSVRRRLGALPRRRRTDADVRASATSASCSSTTRCSRT
jgi:ABC-type glutathione transport system ATPase component